MAHTPGVRRLIVIAFAAIQLVLLARLAIDFGMLSAEGELADLVIRLSETLAAPIQVVAEAIGVNFDAVPGSGMDLAILTALIGWSIVEAIALMVFGRSG
jgi:hypothetical protein